MFAHSKKPLSLGIYAIALLLAALPLWLSVDLPMVDLPQHLYLIQVLHKLGDAHSFVSQWFEIRPGFTPYLGYYHAVSLLSFVFSVDTANRIFLTLYALGLPLSLFILLKALDKEPLHSAWCLPFVYGDSFGWGFINYLASLPIAIFCLATLVASIRKRAQRKVYVPLAAFLLLGVLAFHVQTFAFMALAIPIVLLLCPTEEKESWVKSRVSAALSVLPAVTLFLWWAQRRLGGPTDIAPGQPWKAWGPTFSAENLMVKPFQQNLHELVPVLGNLLQNGRDLWAVYLALALTIAALVFTALISKAKFEKVDFILPLIFVSALTLFFVLPFDIRGYIYYLNTRYAHLAAVLFVALAPSLAFKKFSSELISVSGLVVAATVALPLSTAFRVFNAEAEEVRKIAEMCPKNAKVMGLVYNPQAHEMRLPLFLHAGVTVARLCDGLPNFTFAATPHSPLKYKGTVPPTFPSEWRPDQMSFETQGSFYDVFLVRGAPWQFAVRANPEHFHLLSSGATTTLVKKNAP